MTYADHTFNDKNRIKGWLQRQRLVTALRLADPSRIEVTRMLDFGSGDGELCRQFASRNTSARIYCYEPTPSLLDEARKNLSALNPARYQLMSELSSDLDGSIDLVYCLEVFEHLPPTETHQAIQSIRSLLRPQGRVIIGVPVEIGIPALYKGLFRMARRYGRFDASPRNVWLSMIGSPPQERAVAEIAPGFRFYFEHLGFDWRSLRQILLNEFVVVDTVSSPLTLGSWCMPEIYFVLKKK
jgi:SAM-dependent methyltransferase